MTFGALSNAPATVRVAWFSSAAIEYRVACCARMREVCDARVIAESGRTGMMRGRAESRSANVG